MRKLAPFVLVFGLVALVVAQDGPPTNNANIMTRVDTDNHLVVAAEIRDPNTTTQKAAVSASGALKVECSSGCSGGASFADNSAFTFGTTNINPTGYVFDDVAPNAVTENNAAAPRMSGNRVPYAILRDAAGNERGVNVTVGNALTVDGSAVTQPVSGTVTANQGGTWNIGTVTTVTGATITALPNEGQQTMANSISVALASDQSSVHITCDSGCGGPAAFEDNDAFTFGTTSIGNVGFVVDDASPNAVTENSAGTPRMSANRVAYGQLRDAAGNERGANVNASNALLTAQTGELPAGTQNIGDVDIVSFPDNEPINVAQMNGVAVTMGNGASGTGVQRVTIASDTTGVIQIKGQNSNVPIYCTSTAFVNMTTATTTQIVAASGSLHVYVCSYMIHIRSAVDAKLVSGTGSNCATSQADITPNYDFTNADVGVNRVGGGGNIVTRTNDAGDAVCATSSAATDVDVEINYAQF